MNAEYWMKICNGPTCSQSNAEAEQQLPLLLKPIGVRAQIIDKSCHGECSTAPNCLLMKSYNRLEVFRRVNSTSQNSTSYEYILQRTKEILEFQPPLKPWGQ